MLKNFIIALPLVMSFAAYAEKGDFNQNFNGPTTVCNTSTAYGCANFVTQNVYKKYVQDYGDNAVVCNSSASTGCVINGVTVPNVNDGCIVVNDHLRCY